MNPELFQPSLKPGVNYETKSYDLTYYCIASIIGGFLPAFVLGTKNACWLQVNPLWRNIVIAVSIGLFLFTPISMRSFLGIGVGVMFFFLMRARYKHHLAIHTTRKPILVEAIVFAVLSRALEYFYLTKGVPLLYGY